MIATVDLPEHSSLWRIDGRSDGIASVLRDATNAADSIVYLYPLPVWILCALAHLESSERLTWRITATGEGNLCVFVAAVLEAVLVAIGS